LKLKTKLTHLLTLFQSKRRTSYWISWHSCRGFKNHHKGTYKYT